ncbi:MAG: tRNA (adenosine(37)-N6)-threonylcarbamoyltransferase complex dimerization subunit type 1 TsaB [Pseudomonadota bacterium]
MAFDTSGPFIAIGSTTESYSGGTCEHMARGQAEALMPMLEDWLNNCGWSWQDVDAIGVGIGPGNFTGIRISVSAARGLGLALGIPVFALTGFEIAHGHHMMQPGTLMSLPAPRDLAYVQGFGQGGAALFGPGRLIDPANPPKDLQLSLGMEIHGHRAADIAAHFEVKHAGELEDHGPARMAETTEYKYLNATSFPPPPAPLYIKPPDAAPARDAPPRIVP